MPDGRTFVTDGGLSVDARFAKPAKLPSVVLEPHSGKTIADRMAAPYDKEILLAELRPGSFKNSFATPDGIALNGNYVAFLRQVLPARTRLRTKGKTDAVVAVTDGQAVAIMMPLATPKEGRVTSPRSSRLLDREHLTRDGDSAVARALTALVRRH